MYAADVSACVASANAQHLHDDIPVMRTTSTQCKLCSTHHAAGLLNPAKYWQHQPICAPAELHQHTASWHSWDVVGPDLNSWKAAVGGGWGSASALCCTSYAAA